MNLHPVFKSFLTISGIAASTLVIAQAMPVHWDHDVAMAAVHSVNTEAAAYEIGDITSLSDAASTIGRLKGLESRSDWPLPAREAAIYQFTRSLAELPRDAVAVEVMQYLGAYQARTLVPHEDHGEAFVPLFNIRGAAAGIENAWQRQTYTAKAFTMLEKEPAMLVSSYVKSTHNNQRSGYLDALQQAELTHVLEVQDIALQQLGKTPVLTAMVAATVKITGDPIAIQQLLINGRGAGISQVLVELGQRLPPTEIASLLDFAIQQAPASNATLAIAAWWPGLRHDPATRDLVVGLLADPQLGSSAALALSQNPDIQTIKALQDTASGKSIAAKRAQMALDVNRARLTGGLQP